MRHDGRGDEQWVSSQLVLSRTIAAALTRASVESGHARITGGGHRRRHGGPVSVVHFDRAIGQALQLPFRLVVRVERREALVAHQAAEKHHAVENAVNAKDALEHVFSELYVHLCRADLHLGFGKDRHDFGEVCFGAGARLERPLHFAIDTGVPDERVGVQTLVLVEFDFDPL